MKRSESVLVYAVTAVLAVILVVAVVFGNEGEAADRGAARSSDVLAGGELEDALGLGKDPGDGARRFGAVDPGSQGRDPAAPERGSDPAGGPGTAAPPAVRGTPQYDAPLGPLRAPGSVPTLASLLGPFRVENQLDGTSYRIVTIRRGDTLSELVLRWTGDLSRTRTVLALNEWVDPEALPAGEELRIPYVDDADLLLAYEERQRSRAGRAAPRPAAGGGDDVPPAAAAGRGEVHEIVKGESLWAIAEKRVGRGAASGYVQAILRANPSIRDAGSIRAGDEIVLPPIQ